jgi:hypothetical protein
MSVYSLNYKGWNLIIKDAVLPENHSAGCKHNEESHRSVRNVVGWAVVPHAHHGAVFASRQQTHEGITYLLIQTKLLKIMIFMKS